MECAEDNFLIQMLDKLIRREELLDLLHTNTDELIREFKTGGSLGFSDHDFVEFTDVKIWVR